MKLAEALSVLRSASAANEPYPVLLACGFTPLHLQTYLAAHLQKWLTGRKIEISTGLYDDLAGTLEGLAESRAKTVALVIEWADLDPRLGFRQLGGWGHKVATSILESAAGRLQRLQRAIEAVPASRFAIALPTLPLPPAFHTSTWQASQTELALRNLVAGFGRDVGSLSHVSVVNEQKLAEQSVPGGRYDARSDLHAGFPYTAAHAATLAAALAALIEHRQPKKGIITDLDDTFWAGLVGEVGHENINWDLSSHSQLHGLYQQMLQALADQGVLVAIASKNTPEVVEKALARTDLVVSREKIFPVEVHWEPKSGSVERILKTWNIGPESVVFVDDSPMELEEVRSHFPDIECLVFPKSDYRGAIQLLERLRELFGKPILSEEDSFRVASLRQNEFLASTTQNGTAKSAEAFLAEAEATITLQFDPPASDRRILELVNKTNQFNLNGVRWTEDQWLDMAGRPGSFVIALSYQDKYGPLGKISVVAGEFEGASIHVHTWVLSCRAFSRRIEHHCLTSLFHHFGASACTFAFRLTPKNEPIRAFLHSVLREEPKENIALSRVQFETNCPRLYHRVVKNNQ
jgi:FkbH-like protein